MYTHTHPVLQISVHYIFTDLPQLGNTDWTFDFQYPAIRSCFALFN